MSNGLDVAFIQAGHPVTSDNPQFLTSTQSTGHSEGEEIGVWCAAYVDFFQVTSAITIGQSDRVNDCTFDSISDNQYRKLHSLPWAASARWQWAIYRWILIGSGIFDVKEQNATTFSIKKWQHFSSTLIHQSFLSDNFNHRSQKRDYHLTIPFQNTEHQKKSQWTLCLKASLDYKAVGNGRSITLFIL